MVSIPAGNLSVKLSHQTEWEADIDFTSSYDYAAEEIIRSTCGHVAHATCVKRQQNSLTN